MPRSAPNSPVLDWLLEGDPSVRWQVMRDLLDAPPGAVAAERARVATEGFGARLLALQAPDGTWGGTAWNHGWDSTMHALTLLSILGLDPDCTQARRALALVRDNVTWKGCGPPECDANPYFAGETEPCINAQVAAAGAYFGIDVTPLIDRLLSEQLPDAGWNCDAPVRSARSSFNTTICVVEALLAHESAGHARPDVTAARHRAEEYLLDRRLFHRRSTGEPVPSCRRCGAPLTQLAFPAWWHYDTLRALEHLRATGMTPDKRTNDAVEVLRSKRDATGRWPLEARHPGVMPIEIDAPVGQPSRWNTLRALRVLRWHAR